MNRTIMIASALLFGAACGGYGAAHLQAATAQSGGTPAAAPATPADAPAGRKWETGAVSAGNPLTGPIWITFLKTTAEPQKYKPAWVHEGTFWLAADTFSGTYYLPPHEKLEAREDTGSVIYSGYR